MTNLTFVLLGIAIFAVWLPSIRLNTCAIPPWTVFFAMAVGFGVLSNVLSMLAVLALIALAASSYASLYARASLVRNLSLWASATIALAMALHVLPGFNNLRLYDGVRFSIHSIPFTADLGFDKGAAGLFLLAAFSARVRHLREIKCLARPWLWVIIVGTPALVIAAALMTGSIRLDPKFPPLAWAFIAANLLIVCVAEEAFFRGLIQERLTRLFEYRARLNWIPVAASTALFAVAHLGGGATYLALVTLAGLGYSLVYAVARRIEVAIVTHFVLNAVHFLFFTYPLAAR